ncbi:MAG: protein translocase subunit SecD [Pseudomonadales bacterium]|nr:protein translocase subunit SecD [Pseudomonadales bacterium]
MARTPTPAGTNLLGLPRAAQRPPNTSSIWRYLFIAFLVTLGAIYAAPNLFQPDSALQLRAISSIATGAADELTREALDEAVSALRVGGVPVTGYELTDGTALIRVENDEAQLRGQEILRRTLNAGEQRFVIALTRASTIPAWLVDIGGKQMSLGLDLSGGVHFLLEVDMAKFLGDRMLSNQEAIRDLLVESRLRYTNRDWVNGAQLRITFQDAAARDEAGDLIGEQFDQYLVQARDIDGQPGLILTMAEDKIRELEDLAITQNLQSLRNRVNELGVSEPLVQRLGRSRIVLDLPGIQDSARAKEIINKFANLEFRLVAGPGARASQTERHEYNGAPVDLETRNIVTGDQVTNALQDFDPETGQPQVSITLDNDGGRAMNEVTKDNVGNSMAILFKELQVRTRTVMKDGVETQVPYTVEHKRLINVATIQSALGFRFRITGLELGEARDLALLLRAGALAAPMYIVEERTVGASLGDENIAAGQQSMLIGVAIVMLFMLFYYRMFGLAANLALMANVMLLVAIMSVLGATLTLPGIAGIVLTVGMAVDANVLIFSRIREELVERSPQAAIQVGFDRALLTILDANITTFFVAIILFSLGSGPVKGFAVTLAIGIVTSVFTAVMGTRALVNLMYGGRKLERLKI